jgi:hypothetical protein
MKAKRTWSNRDLQQYYDLYNEWYFDGRLPPLVTLRFGYLGNMLGHTSRFRRLKARCSAGDGFGIVIALRDKDSRRHWLLTLVHEMVHVEQRLCHDCDARNRKFNGRMRGLAAEGAFDGLW